jgi:hypothetical protein
LRRVHVAVRCAHPAHARQAVPAFDRELKKGSGVLRRKPTFLGQLLTYNAM